MPSSVRRLTRLDHERIGRLLRRTVSPGPSRDRWRAELVALLRAHRTAERDGVLVAVVAGVPALAGRARAQAEADVELDRTTELLDAADLDDGAHLRTVHDRAAARLAAHTASWDTLMAPLEQHVARAELRRLGGEYERRRDEAMERAGVVAPPPRRLDLSRAELYEMARRAGIEGRSAMTRQQLIDELRQRSDWPG